MKKISLPQVLLIVASLLVAGGLYVQRSSAVEDGASKVTLTGTISDSWCRGSHLRKAQTWMSCTNFCASRGARYVLMVGSRAYELDGVQSNNAWTVAFGDLQHDQIDTRIVASLAGSRATVTGFLSGDRISVLSIAKAEKGKSNNGK